MSDCELGSLLTYRSLPVSIRDTCGERDGTRLTSCDVLLAHRIDLRVVILRNAHACLLALITFICVVTQVCGLFSHQRPGFDFPPLTVTPEIVPAGRISGEGV